MNLSILIYIIRIFFSSKPNLYWNNKTANSTLLEILTFYIFCILKTFPMQGFFYLSYFYTFNLVICSWSWLPNKRTWLLKLNMYLCLVLNEKGHSTTYISCFYVVVLLCTINFGAFFIFMVNMLMASRLILQFPIYLGWAGATTVEGQSYPRSIWQRKNCQKWQLLTFRKYLKFFSPFF